MNQKKATVLRHRQSSRATGFILVMVLVLLAIVGTTTAALARKCMIESTTALRTEESLQRTWGMRSVADVFAGSTEAGLKSAQNGQEEPLQSVAFQFTLNNMPINIIFSDEQAKPNVNTLYTMHGLNQSESIITHMIREQDSFPPTLEVRLRPLERTSIAVAGLDIASQDWLAFSSYSSIFNQQSIATILDVPSHDTAINSFSMASPSSFEGKSPVFKSYPGVPVTCWGNGKVYFARASKQALLAVSEDVIGTHLANELIQIRHDRPGLSALDVIDQLGLTQLQRGKMDERLTDVSHCHSWTVSTQNGRGSFTIMRVEIIRDDGQIGLLQYEQSWP